MTNLLVLTLMVVIVGLITTDMVEKSFNSKQSLQSHLKQLEADFGPMGLVKF